MTMDTTLYNRQQSASAAAGSTGGTRYQRIIEDIQRKQAIKDALDSVLYGLVSGRQSEQQARDELARVGAASPAGSEQSATLLGIFTASSSNDVPLMTQIDAQLSNYTDQLYSLAQQAVSLGGMDAIANPDVAQYIAIDDQIDLVKAFTGGSGGGFQPAPFQFQTLGNGDVLSFNPNTSEVTKIGNFPDAVQKQVEVDRNGNLVSINPFTNETTVIKKGFGFAQVDPRVEFQTQTALGLAQIDVQQRGQWVSALGADMANRISIGALTYEEARTNVNTVVNALNQRRADTEILLKYAVPQSTIFTDPKSGQRMSRLPGADALANILAESTGQRVDNLFSLPVGTINPEASAQDVMRAGAFNSPIPGLMSELENTRQMVSSILGAPVADAEVARAAAAKIAGGM